MNKAKLIFSLLFFVSLFSYGQRMNKVDASVTKLISDGWHKFSLQDVKYDVKVMNHAFVKGNIYWPDGATYSGSLGRNGMRGKGTYTWANGARYEGAMKNNMRHGKGTMYLKDGTRFTCKWKENRKNGKGTLYDANEQILKTGVWKEGVLLENK
tara:strand:- start:6765 stop:7226 length:462 start_codon:yes stop_codon:yes gene_type:complete